MGAHNGSPVPGGAEQFGRGDTAPRNGHDPRPGVPGSHRPADAHAVGAASSPDALDAERARLEAEIAAAVARKQAAAHSQDDTNAALHAVVVRMQERLAEMEERHAAALTAIRTAGEAEVARITADAERRASRDVHPATTPVDPLAGGVA